MCSPQATQTFSRSGVCSLGLFHTTAQVAAAWHPLAEQIPELSWSLTRPALQAGVPCSQDQTRRWPGDGRDVGDALRTQHQGVQDKACAAIYFDLKKWRLCNVL